MQGGCDIAIELDGAPLLSELGDEVREPETIREAVRKRDADHPRRAEILR